MFGFARDENVCTYLLQSVETSEAPGLPQSIFDVPPAPFPPLEQPRPPRRVGLLVFRVRVHLRRRAVVRVPPFRPRRRDSSYQVVEHAHVDILQQIEQLNVRICVAFATIRVSITINWRGNKNDVIRQTRRRMRRFGR